MFNNFLRLAEIKAVLEGRGFRPNFLVKVWIDLSYRYFSPYSPHRTNCNALDLLLAANTDDCFFLSVLDAPSAKNQVSRVVTATMVHQRVWFDKAFMHLLAQNATLRLIASASVLSWSQQQVFLNVKRSNRFSLSVYQMGQRVSRLYSIDKRSNTAAILLVGSIGIDG
ncbi:hypothetical protein QUB56_03870 [Microcoleus sp. AR_TQ3_B6]